MYKSTKTYGHNLGLSACFRQWGATHSHCHLIHGYSLEVHVEFEAEKLDHINWVVDFGGLGEFKSWLKDTFDHKTLVAQDDPEIDFFLQGQKQGLMDVVVVEATGCEAFSKMIYDHLKAIIFDKYDNRVRVSKVEVREHGANSAMYVPKG